MAKEVDVFLMEIYKFLIDKRSAQRKISGSDFG